jgi:tetratricopeptide (TPR) repeat protein
VGDDSDNIIHVTFERDGNVRRQKKARHDDGATAERRRPAKDDPLADLYSRREVSRLFGLTDNQLKYWDTSGFIQPSGRAGDKRYYTFQDLISVRAAKGLTDQGVPLRKVRRSVEALRQALPKVVRPLQELRVVADGTTVLVRDENGAFEPLTGQLVLDFRVDSLRQDVVRVLRRNEPSPDKRRTAYEHYLEGCRLDEDESTFDRAEEEYLAAVRLDPSLANALTNLGNLRYRRGSGEEAEQLYRQALAIDPTQPEAGYNLGFLAYEGGDIEAAADHFERALTHDPSFADAHFNLAMAFEELGRHAEARPHWETYVELEPSGPWAEIARRHLRHPRR